MRMNGLCDKEIMQKLIEASCAGVKIDLLVRGICCLLPEQEGLTENITIKSIVGRYLEHARVYIFGIGEDAKVYLGSADCMPRNTVRRVEVCAPVKDAALRKRLTDEFQLQFHDPVKARVRKADGDYLLPESRSDMIDSQSALYARACQRAENTAK